MREGDAAPVLCKSAAVLATATLSLDSALALSHNLAEPADTRAARVAQLATDALAAVSAVECNGGCSSTSERGQAACLRGRALQLLERAGEAEEALTRAVKLCPASADAWNSLGEIAWKRGALPEARSLFQTAFARCANAASLCNLSGVARGLAQGVATAAERQALTSESVTHARAALTLDVTEGRHWYQLGLALMAQAFGTGSASSSDLAPAAKAFAHAVQRGEGERNADLLFNRAVLLRYLDELQGALDSFRASGRLDPALPWQAQTQALLRDATRVHVLVAARGHTRPKRYAAAAAQVAATPLPAGVLAPTLTALTPGMNGGCALGCMVLAMASAPGAMPAVAVAVDGAGICFAITAYGLRDSALREGLPVALLAPLLTHVRVAAPDGELAYALVRVEGALGMRCLQRGAWEAPTSQAESPSVTFSV